jgi:hypothetical protein
VAWRKRTDRFPAPLREFREEDWPRVPGECLGHYTCRSPLEGGDCAPPPGSYCGQACYEMLARDHGTEALANAKRADAFTRYHQARLAWLGEYSPEWITEFYEGDEHHAIRYAHIRDQGRDHGMA